MSAYRYMATGSWSSQMEKHKDRRKEFEKKLVKMLEILNEETEFKYHRILNEKILRRKSCAVYDKVMAQKSLDISDYDTIKRTTFKWKIRILLQLKFPKIVNKLREIKRKIWK